MGKRAGIRYTCTENTPLGLLGTSQKKDLCHSFNNSGLGVLSLVIFFFPCLKSCKIASLWQNLQKILNCYMNTSDSVGVGETVILYAGAEISQEKVSSRMLPIKMNIFIHEIIIWVHLAHCHDFH